MQLKYLKPEDVYKLFEQRAEYDPKPFEVWAKELTRFNSDITLGAIEQFKKVHARSHSGLYLPEILNLISREVTRLNDLGELEEVDGLEYELMRCELLIELTYNDQDRKAYKSKAKKLEKQIRERKERSDELSENG